VKQATEGAVATYDRIVTIPIKIERKIGERVASEHPPLSSPPSAKRHKRQPTGSTKNKGKREYRKSIYRSHTRKLSLFR